MSKKNEAIGNLAVAGAGEENVTATLLKQLSQRVRVASVLFVYQDAHGRMAL